MANEEALTLDGLAVTDGISFGMMTFSAPPPRQRQDWIGAADSEFQVLMRNPLHENRKITAKIAVIQQASMDLAHDKLALVIDKLAKASKTPEGISLGWTPASSTRTVTFDVLSGEIIDLPIDYEAGWLAFSPEITIELTAKPYWRATKHTTVTDAYGSNSIADYTFDAGAAGNVAITGGVIDAAANFTTENRFLHAASPYAVTSSQVTVKHTLGTTVTSYKAGVILKRLDASNYLEVYVDDNGTNSRLRIDRIIAGSRTNLVSTNLGARLSASTAYWVRGRIEGNLVTAEHWTSAPTVTGTATLSNATTLAGADATTLGAGISGRAGLVWTPQQTAATLDDLEIAPNVFVSSTPFVTGELANVPGDIPALGEATITDSAGQSRRHVEWGVEGQYYNSATSLLIDSDDMVTSGFAGSQASTAGCYDPNASGNNSISAPLYSTPAAIAGLGNLTHIGTFRVKARTGCQAPPGTFVRLAWQAGDGPLTSNAWASDPIGGEFIEMDLGTITVPPVTAGTQRWTGRVEAYTTVEGSVIKLDYLELIPVTEGYGKARATYNYSPGVIVGQDSFTATTTGAALNGRTAPSGGAWATSGDATDLGFTDSPSEGLARATNPSSVGRFAILGSTTYADTEVAVTCSATTTSGGAAFMGVVARYTDASNKLDAYIESDATSATLGLRQKVGGVLTEAHFSSFPFTLGSFYRIRLIVYASGWAFAHVLDSAGALLAATEFVTAGLATGGGIASGKVGIWDASSASAGTRFYDDFAVSTPAAEPIAIYSGRNMQVRYDDVIRQDSSGTYMGRPTSYRGSRCLIPVGASRLLVKARRNNLDTARDDQVTDRTQVQVDLTPRGLAVPR